MNPKLSLHVDIDDLINVKELLCKNFNVIEAFDGDGIYSNKLDDLESEIIFTNPNNCPVYYDRGFLSQYKDLKYLVTASTGTVHININDAKELNIKVISITKEIDTLRKITSTAEHALCLTLAAVRKLPLAINSVNNGFWNYAPFIGRQINMLNVGVIGFGRLGKIYANMLRDLGSKVSIYDPYKSDEIKSENFQEKDLDTILTSSDVVSIHCHVTNETTKMIDHKALANIKEDLIIINTARGEIVDEYEICKKLDSTNFYYYTDVISKEYLGLDKNILFNSKFFGKNIFITPHQGGMTYDARLMAYSKAAAMLVENFNHINP